MWHTDGNLDTAAIWKDPSPLMLDHSVAGYLVDRLSFSQKIVDYKDNRILGTYVKSIIGSTLMDYKPDK